MNLESLVALAVRRGASDLHLEPGLPAAIRIQGEMRTVGETLSAPFVRGLVRAAVGEAGWEVFLQRGSADLALTLAGVRCRLSALLSMRGAGLAIRLLPATVPTVEGLNLHPELERLAEAEHGLILVSGSSGSGKTSTLAALLSAISHRRASHLITLENPVEIMLPTGRSVVRQREIGRDTPSFEQGLRDALRQDPDVIMVGEMREPQVMQLVLNAAETGRLVLTTLHASRCVEALQRMVLAFPAEIQPGICSQLADCLSAVVCQRLRFRDDLDLRVPECEILLPTSGARGAIRTGDFYKLPSVLETGGGEGLWTFDRYRTWLGRKTDWHRPFERLEPPVPENISPPTPKLAPAETLPGGPVPAEPTEPVLVIDPPESDVSDILSELEGRRRS